MKLEPQEKAPLSGIRVICFDFDGVLIDSAADMADSVNASLEQFGLQRIDTKSAVSYVGHGAKNLISKSVAHSCRLSGAEYSDELAEKVLSFYRDYYNSHATIKTGLYPGVIPFLKFLSINDIRIALVSNKPVRSSRVILEYFNLISFFDIVVGPELIEKIKPAPDGISLAASTVSRLLQAIEQPGVQPEQILMIGDSAVDIQAARAYGARSCGCTKGLGKKEEMLAENPDYTVQTLTELIPLFGADCN